jgi:hypothetical protein
MVPLGRLCRNWGLIANLREHLFENFRFEDNKKCPSEKGRFSFYRTISISNGIRRVDSFVSRKMSENAAESHKSAARFVGRGFVDSII